jgi:hypothetical protein
MQINPIPTEQTTALTDGLLAVYSFVVVVSLWHRRSMAPLKTRLWIGVFAGLALAGGLGTAFHGLELDEVGEQLLWQPLRAALGFTVVCIVAAAVLDRWGQAAARRVFPGLILLSAGFLLFGAFVSEAFLGFIIYEGAAMLFCLWVYATLALRRSLPGAVWMFVGVVLTLTAAAIQTLDFISFTLFLPFNSNGAFHLIQLIALTAFWAGLRQTRLMLLSMPRPA